MKNNKLVQAVHKGDLDSVKKLIKIYDVNSTNKHGNTILISAVSRGYLNIVKFLLENGADVNKCNKHNNSPLILACVKGYYDIIKLLLNCPNIKLNIQNKNCKTALFLARDYATIKLLVKKYCNMELRDKFGNTPFLCAARNKSMKIIKLLIKYGCNHKVKDYRGFSYETYLFYGSKRKIEKYLSLRNKEKLLKLCIFYIKHNMHKFDNNMLKNYLNRDIRKYFDL